MNTYIIKKGYAEMQLNNIKNLLSETYWASERPQETIEISMKNSICYGVFAGQEQIGFARAITDYATTYYLCDVIISSKHRGAGVGKLLLDYIVNDPDTQHLRGILATKDAHTFYEQYGFIDGGNFFMQRPKQE